MKTLKLESKDGYALAATIYGNGRGAIALIAGATGVPQRHYAKFAEFLAAQGLRALTVDYRGIGASRHGSLRGFQADYFDWAEKDLGAALDWALQQGPVGVIGHSFGGHAFGMLARADETLGLLAFGTGAGWNGYMPFAERQRARFFWRLLGPALTRVYGYLPSRLVGLGEDLPLEVFRQWTRWCAHPNYFFGDPTFGRAAQFAKLECGIVAVNATDDLWAPPASARAFFAGYSDARVTHETLEPKALGLASIGHMGYFRSQSREAIWPRAVEWLKTAERLKQ